MALAQALAWPPLFPILAPELGAHKLVSRRNHAKRLPKSKASCLERALLIEQSMSNMEIARQVSPTLAGRRTRSGFRAVETRQRLALTSSKAVASRSASCASAEPFFDELLTVDADASFRRFRWLLLALVAVAIMVGLSIVLAAGP